MKWMRRRDVVATAAAFIESPLRATTRSEKINHPRESHAKPSTARTRARCTFNSVRSKPVQTVARDAHRVHVLLGPCECEDLVLLLRAYPSFGTSAVREHGCLLQGIQVSGAELLCSRLQP